MGEGTKIGWTDNTWGGKKIGCNETTNPGCRECYAIHRVLPKMGIQPGQFHEVMQSTFEQPLKWQKRLEATGQVETVFNSLTDWFHPHNDDVRTEGWDIIRKCPNLIFILLTQRPGNIESRLPDDWGEGWRNVWLGVSASDQVHADKRIPSLLRIPAAMHVLSLEPLVEQIRLKEGWLKHSFIEGPMKRTNWIGGPQELPTARLSNRIGWVITGGMSGPNAKKYPLYPSWVRGLRDQCVEWDIPFFFKQLGGWPDYRDGDKALLDGQLWQQIPASTATPIHIPQQTTLFD